MLAGNKPVLCEKPFTMNVCETQELINAAQARGLFLMEAMWTRFFPVYQEICSALKRDEMQDVRLVRAEFGANLTNVPRCIQKELGGGAVLDIGIYCLQLISMVYKGEKPEEIHSTGNLSDKASAPEALMEKEWQSYVWENFMLSQGRSDNSDGRALVRFSRDLELLWILNVTCCQYDGKQLP
uniref:trans-1,2-dihydrobenzene-1,2-diol dehydrogenase-like n=1 Tax=Myxine glutinosa TaxID=7769 RepID=UPI00358DDDCD